MDIDLISEHMLDYYTQRDIPSPKEIQAAINRLKKIQAEATQARAAEFGSSLLEKLGISPESILGAAANSSSSSSL